MHLLWFFLHSARNVCLRSCFYRRNRIVFAWRNIILPCHAAEAHQLSDRSTFLFFAFLSNSFNSETFILMWMARGCWWFLWQYLEYLNMRYFTLSNLYLLSSSFAGNWFCFACLSDWTHLLTHSWMHGKIAAAVDGTRTFLFSYIKSICWIRSDWNNSNQIKSISHDVCTINSIAWNSMELISLSFLPFLSTVNMSWLYILFTNFEGLWSISLSLIMRWIRLMNGHTALNKHHKLWITMRVAFSSN